MHTLFGQSGNGKYGKSMFLAEHDWGILQVRVLKCIHSETVCCFVCLGFLIHLLGSISSSQLKSGKNEVETVPQFLQHFVGRSFEDLLMCRPCQNWGLRGNLVDKIGNSCYFMLFLFLQVTLTRIEKSPMPILKSMPSSCRTCSDSRRPLVQNSWDIPSGFVTSIQPSNYGIMCGNMMTNCDILVPSYPQKNKRTG